MNLSTPRLLLETLTPLAAEEMVVVLADEALYTHTGGAPPDIATLRERYERQSAGRSPDGTEVWLNWIVRERATGAAVGFVQATIVRATGNADVAWLIGVAHQRRGYASEAAGAAVAWLAAGRLVASMTAHIAESNVASQGVARRLGFEPTGTFERDEVVWSRRRGRS